MHDIFAFKRSTKILTCKIKFRKNIILITNFVITNYYLKLFSLTVNLFIKQRWLHPTQSHFQ